MASTSLPAFAIGSPSCSSRSIAAWTRSTTCSWRPRSCSISRRIVRIASTVS